MFLNLRSSCAEVSPVDFNDVCLRGLNADVCPTLLHLLHRLFWLCILCMQRVFCVFQQKRSIVLVTTPYCSCSDKLKGGWLLWQSIMALRRFPSSALALHLRLGIFFSFPCDNLWGPPLSGDDHFLVSRQLHVLLFSDNKLTDLWVLWQFPLLRQPISADLGFTPSCFGFLSWISFLFFRDCDVVWGYVSPSWLWLVFKYWLTE